MGRFLKMTWLLFAILLSSKRCVFAIAINSGTANSTAINFLQQLQSYYSNSDSSCSSCISGLIDGLNTNSLGIGMVPGHFAGNGTDSFSNAYSAAVLMLKKSGTVDEEDMKLYGKIIETYQQVLNAATVQGELGAKETAELVKSVWELVDELVKFGKKKTMEALGIAFNGQSRSTTAPNMIVAILLITLGINFM